MLSMKWIRENVDLMTKSTGKRDEKVDLNKLLSLDNKRRALIKETDELRHMQNIYSKEIGQLKNQSRDPENLIKKVGDISSEIKSRKEEKKRVEEEVKDFLFNLSNKLHPDVLGGDENIEKRRWGSIRKFDFPPKNHQQLGESLGILDFKRGVKIAGSGFVLYKGLGALLERALINFMLDVHISQGYEEVLPPFMTNTNATRDTGQLPKFRGELYKCERDDYYLVPTAEVPVTNIHREEILPEDSLPLSYTAYTPCFRREAGAYGKKIQGMIRQHQFNKVELVKFTAPQNSYEELEELLSDAEEILKKLELPFRVVQLCGKELGFSAAFGYDIEVWLPSQEKFLEISTCSNCEDFQARRASIKYRDKENDSTRYVHTLNGSGLAVGRTVVAILENFQEKDGRVLIPEALRPYMQGKKWIEKV
ncbi:MAG: serine--tRNA ligase [Candidatus Aerophobetes bacterium]|nr:serine--tRNA ligase [Candidatus Aerophobetes bacterium]